MEPDSDMAEQRGQQQAPSSSEDKPFADFAYLPGQRLTGVLVPAFVSKVEDTVQRMANLQQVPSDGRPGGVSSSFFDAPPLPQALRGESEVLMLRLRQDPLSRPLLGTKREPASSEILLRVVHRVSRTTGAIESSRFTPVGMVDQSWEFTSLADFQVADARPLSKRPKIGMRGAPSLLFRPFACVLTLRAARGDGRVPEPNAGDRAHSHCPAHVCCAQSALGLPLSHQQADSA